MAINIQAPMVDAVVALRGNRDFEHLLEVMVDFVQHHQMAAAASAPADRVDQTSYARGMFDFWQGMQAAYVGVNPVKVKAPPLSRTRQD